MDIMRKISFMFMVICWMTAVSAAHAVRIKDIADVRGVRKNPLIGYGLVVGLEGTGDGRRALFTVQSLSMMLEQMGVSVNPDSLRVGNAAAVMVTGELPPFAKSGGRIDVTVSSIGDAKSLQGGTLLLTPLKAANGMVYAVAQGSISIGGFSGIGEGASLQKNFLTVGRIAGGATIEKSLEVNIAPDNRLTLILRNPDFTTASRIAQAVNSLFPQTIATARDPSAVEINIPPAYQHHKVEFVTHIEGLPITPDSPAKVVINERTGTVVMGEHVHISTVAVAHGNLSIEIKEVPEVSQPEPFSAGQTVVVPGTQVTAREEQRRLSIIKSGVSIADLVKALNALGVSPRDLIAIFQAIKAAGALQGELEII